MQASGEAEYKDVVIPYGGELTVNSLFKRPMEEELLTHSLLEILSKNLF